jgi:hypothetical protein
MEESRENDDGKRHQKLLATLSAVGNVRELLYGRSAPILAFAALSDGAWSKARKVYLSRLEAAIMAAGLDWTEWKTLVVRHIAKQRRDWRESLGRPLTKPAGTRPPLTQPITGSALALQEAVRHQFAVVLDGLESIPPSLKKATDAIAYLLESSPSINDPVEKDSCFPDLLTAINSEALPCSGTYRRRLREQLITGELPVAPTYWEDEWTTAWVRYAERHALHHSRRLVRAVSNDIEQRLRDGLQTLWSNGTPCVPCHNLLGQLYRCWVVSFSLRLRARAAPVVADILRAALTWQEADGGWANAWDREASKGRCADTTALAVYCLLRYGDHEEWTHAAERGIDWLLTNCNAGGGWGRANIRGSTDQLNICTTVAALDALRLYGIPLDHPTVRQAEAALMSAQHPSGTWVDCRGQAEDYLTALVVGYFHRREQRPSKMHEAIVLGRGLMLKAHALSLSQANTDSVLALVSLFHGLEYTLYGFLLEDGSVSIRRSGAETIGLRVALQEFETVAKRRGWTPASNRLPFKTQLEELAAKRDEVIHRMATVQSTHVEQFVESVFSFISRFDLHALGYSLLD